MDGYIKLHRRIIEWGWYEDANTFRLFIHLLLKANYYDSEFKGRTVKRGQRFTSISNLAKEIKLSDKAIRISLDKLIKTNEVVVNGANNGTMITVCKYDIYQGNPETEGQTRGERKGKRRATNKEEEEIEEKKEIKYTVLSFDDFWKMYGKSADKIKCQKLYDKITEKEREDIKVKLPIYLSTIKDKKFQKNPHTYLYGKCWNDIDDVSEMQNEDESQETLKELYPNCFWQINSKKIYYKPDWAK